MLCSGVPGVPASVGAATVAGTGDGDEATSGATEAGTTYARNAVWLSPGTIKQSQWEQLS